MYNYDVALTVHFALCRFPRTEALSQQWHQPRDPLQKVNSALPLYDYQKCLSGGDIFLPPVTLCMLSTVCVVTDYSRLDCSP